MSPYLYVFQERLTQEGLIKIEGWARDDLTDRQIGHNIGVSRSTLAVWKNKYRNISNAFKKRKASC